MSLQNIKLVYRINNFKILFVITLRNFRRSLIGKIKNKFTPKAYNTKIVKRFDTS